MATKRYKEGGTIHAEYPCGDDRTLCGAALEGEDGDDEMQEVARGKINCPDCLNTIQHCKSIPARLCAKQK